MNEIIIRQLTLVEILTQKNIFDLKDYIYQTYNDLEGIVKAKLLAGAITKILEKRLEPIEERYKKKIINRLYQEASSKNNFNIHGGQVLQACMELETNITSYYHRIATWIHALTQTEISWTDIQAFHIHYGLKTEEEKTQLFSTLKEVTKDHLVEGEYAYALEPQDCSYFASSDMAFDFQEYFHKAHLHTIQNAMFVALCLFWLNPFNMQVPLPEPLRPEEVKIIETKESLLVVNSESFPIIEQPPVQDVAVKGIQMDMIATAYDLSIESCGKDRDHPAYGITASGKVATVGRTVAVDPKIIPLGTKLHILFPEEYAHMDGYYIAEDTGSGIKGNKIDVFFGEDEIGEKVVNKAAMQFGIRAVVVTILEEE